MQLRELNVDLFAGGGGASEGFKLATGFDPDIAINHSPEAVALHKANHPNTKHFTSDIWEVHPKMATGNHPVGFLWASPDCTHFSKAKGGKPKSKKIRSLAWVTVKWAAIKRPRVIGLENVPEFKDWGPLLMKWVKVFPKDEDGNIIPDAPPTYERHYYPDPDRKGQTFNEFVEKLKRLGYEVDWRILKACDYGAPTIRKRLFLIARRDGQPIVWPDSTHGHPDSWEVEAGIVKPWRTTAECIDWSIPTYSIFMGKKEAKKHNVRRPLADSTMSRLARGIKKFVMENNKPFIVTCNHSGEGFRGQGIDKPMNTITANRDAHGIVVPYMVGIDHKSSGDSAVWDIKTPLTTITTENRHALTTAFLAKHYTGVTGTKVDSPIGTITTADHHSLVLTHVQRDFGMSVGSSMEEPIGSITGNGNGKAAIVASHVVKMKGTNTGHGTDEPIHTITANGLHFGEVRTLMIKHFESTFSDNPDMAGIVHIDGEAYKIIDIGMRMFSPRELFTAQGFPEDYIIDINFNGKMISKKAQVSMCGNSVPPPMAAAIIGANYTVKRKEKELIAA